MYNSISVCKNGFYRGDFLIFKLIDFTCVEGNESFIDYCKILSVVNPEFFNENETPETVEKEYHFPNIPSVVLSAIKMYNYMNRKL